MRWNEIDSEICSIARTLSIVGDRWTLLVLRDSFFGACRFNEFQKSIGLSRHRLADRLNRLVESEFLKKVRYQDTPPRYEYKLTTKGVDIYTVLLSLTTWGNKWMSDADGDPVEYKHRSCGHITTPVLCCDECKAPIIPQELMPIVGPGILRKMPRDEELNYLPPILAKSLQNI